MSAQMEIIMLKSNRKIPMLASLGVACGLLIAIPAIAHPEKDRYGNDISSRIPADTVMTAEFLTTDDFRAPPNGNVITGSVETLASCSRQTPAACQPTSKPSH
jgi:hypothetical protein